MTCLALIQGELNDPGITGWGSNHWLFVTCSRINCVVDCEYDWSCILWSGTTLRSLGSPVVAGHWWHTLSLPVSWWQKPANPATNCPTHNWASPILVFLWHSVQLPVLLVLQWCSCQWVLRTSLVSTSCGDRFVLGPSPTVLMSLPLGPCISAGEVSGLHPSVLTLATCWQTAAAY